MADILVPLTEITAATMTSELKRYCDHDYYMMGMGKRVKLIIPDGTTTIEADAFWKCTALSQVYFPAALIKIEDGAFMNCTALTGIYFPRNSALKVIKNAAFLRCTALTEVSFPAALTRIGSYAFEECVSLREVHFPPALTRIEGGAFKRCKKLTVVRCRSTQIGIIAPSIPRNTRLVAICPATITDMAGNQYILDLTVPLTRNNFNPVEQLMNRHGAKIDADQDPEVDNDNVELRIMSVWVVDGNEYIIDISEHIGAIRNGEVDFQKLVLHFGLQATPPQRSWWF